MSDATSGTSSSPLSPLLRGVKGRIVIVVTFLLILPVWSFVAWLLAPDGEGELVLLPGPLVVLNSLQELLFEESFLVDIGQSIMRIALGVLVAMVPAFILGIWFGTNKRLHSAVQPVFAFAKYIPPVSFVPILVLWVGVGLSQQIALLFIGVFFLLTLMVAASVAATPRAYLDAGLTLGVSRRRLIPKVIIPHCLPTFIEHMRAVISVAWTYLVVVEMVAAPSGIGRVIINSQRFLDTSRVLAGMLTIGLLGVLSDQILAWISRRFCRWSHARA